MNPESPILSLDNRFLKTERLAWVLDVSEWTVGEWSKKKLITRFKVGHIDRYSPEAAAEFIFRNSIQARNKSPLPLQSLESRLIAQDWQRMERLIADQVAARMERAA